MVKGTRQREYSSKPLKHSIVKRILIFKGRYRHIFIPQKIFHLFGFRKHPFLLALRRWGSFARNAPSGEERGETDVLAGYKCSENFRSQIVFRTDIFRKLTLGAS